MCVVSPENSAILTWPDETSTFRKTTEAPPSAASALLSHRRQFVAIELASLLVERPQVIKQSEAQQPTAEQVDDAGNPFPHVEAMDANSLRQAAPATYYTVPVAQGLFILYSEGN